jgi:intron-binding protein aquarius
MATHIGRGGRQNRRQANLPYNKEGRISAYSKDGGRRALERTKKVNDSEGLLGEGGPKFLGRKYAPTMDQIYQDRLTTLSNKFWSPQTMKTHIQYTPSVIEDIYNTDLNIQETTIVRRAMLLEYSQYLENYLWSNFEAANCTKAHVMSIVMMVNEKFRERVPAWSSFQKQPKEFPGFFHRVMELSLKHTGTFTGFVDPVPKLQSEENTVQEPGEISNGKEVSSNGNGSTTSSRDQQDSITLREQSMLLVFLDHCFTSLEVELVRDQIQRLVSLSMWVSMMESRREHELKGCPEWKKYWKAITKKDKKVTDDSLKVVTLNERWFLKNLIEKFYNVLETIQEKEATRDVVSYCEYFLLLMIGKLELWLQQKSDGQTPIPNIFTVPN